MSFLLISIHLSYPKIEEGFNQIYLKNRRKNQFHKKKKICVIIFNPKIEKQYLITLAYSFCSFCFVVRESVLTSFSLKSRPFRYWDSIRVSNKRSDLLLMKLAPESIMPEDEFVASGAMMKVMFCRFPIECLLVFQGGVIFMMTSYLHGITGG